MRSFYLNHFSQTSRYPEFFLTPVIKIQDIRSLLPPIILLLLFLLLTGCTNQSALPPTRPEDFTLLYQNDGGMFPLNEQIYLSTTESWFSSHHFDAESGYSLSLTDAQLDQLYATLRQNRFDLIETYQENVLDRGGISISITANGEKYELHNSGIDFISYKWQEEWDQIIGMINWLVEDAGQQAKQPFTLYIDQSLLEQDISLHLNMNALVQEPIITQHLIPGQYYLKIQLNEPPFSYSEFLITHPTTNTSTLSYEQNTLYLKTK